MEPEAYYRIDSLHGLNPFPRFLLQYCMHLLYPYFFHTQQSKNTPCDNNLMRTQGEGKKMSHVHLCATHTVCQFIPIALLLPCKYPGRIRSMHTFLIK